MERHFKRLVALLCLGYLAVQVCYILRLPLVMDEFDHAAHVFRLTQLIPYRDHAPAKTVLGYYLLLPALLAFSSTWSAMLAVKFEIACLTAGALLLVALRLRRHFAGPAIIGSLLLLCTQNTFLERSSELRVDMLASLCGLLSLTAFLERRGWLAGAAAGCAVLMTQKGAYFVLALGGALLFQILYLRSARLLREALCAGAAASLVVLGYVGFWCAVGRPALVWQGMVLGPSTVAFDNLYSIRGYWWQTLLRNPVFYALALGGCLQLRPRSAEDGAEGRLWAYALILMGLCLWHKQPWPYFFVLLIPTAWVLGAALLHRNLGAGPWRKALGIAVVAGAAASLALRLPAVLQRSSAPQRDVVAAIDAFLRPGETYLAGTELAWRRPHVAGLTWLDRLALQGVQSSTAAVLQELRAAPPRLLIDNYRVKHLPREIREELRGWFAWVGGNLRTYAPPLATGSAQQLFAYSGSYLVRAAPAARVRLDGGPWLQDGERVEVAVGTHATDVIGAARLISWSEAPEFQRQVENPSVQLFDRVYDY